MVLWFKSSIKKHCVAKVLLAILEIFLHENNCNYNSYKFSFEFAFIILLSFLFIFLKYFCFLFITSCALFQSHAECSRLLWNNFLTCYSYLYYTSVLLITLLIFLWLKLEMNCTVLSYKWIDSFTCHLPYHSFQFVMF